MFPPGERKEREKKPGAVRPPVRDLKFRCLGETWDGLVKHDHPADYTELCTYFLSEDQVMNTVPVGTESSHISRNSPLPAALVKGSKGSPMGSSR